MKNSSYNTTNEIFKIKCQYLFNQLNDISGTDNNFQTNIEPIKICIKELNNLLMSDNKFSIVDKDGYGPLHYAAIFGDLSFFKFCLAQGYPLNQKTAPHYGVYTVYEIAKEYNSTNIINYLGAKNLIDIYIRDYYNNQKNGSSMEDSIDNDPADLQVSGYNESNEY